MRSRPAFRTFLQQRGMVLRDQDISHIISAAYKGADDPANYTVFGSDVNRFQPLCQKQG